MQIIQQYMPVGSKRRSGQLLTGIKYIVCHDTANDGASAKSNADYYTRSANDMEASAHSFVDESGVIEVMPLTEKAWHCRYNAGIAPNIAGSFANDCALGIELCYSTQGLFNSRKAYTNYVEYIASLCDRYKLNPLKDLFSHAALDPTRRTDPMNAFGKIGVTWNSFIQDVVKACAPKPVPPPSMPPIPEELVSVMVPKSKVEIIKKIIEILK